MIRTLIAWACLLLGVSCAVPLTVTPPDDATRERQSREMVESIRSAAMPGDWLVSRGYKKSDDVVAAATNMPLSHAAVYDKENDAVIEAEQKGVHLSSLADFVHKSHRVVVIRPIWSNEQSCLKAVEEARSLVGEEYDLLGTIGFDNPEKYYCSELTVHVYRSFFRPNEQLPKVIEPGHLYLWGRVLYDSHPRDLMDLAPRQ